MPSLLREPVKAIDKNHATICTATIDVERDVKRDYSYLPLIRKPLT